MRTLWRGFKLTVGLVLSAPISIVGLVGYAIDQICEWAINGLARWAKK